MQFETSLFNFDSAAASLFIPFAFPEEEHHEPEAMIRHPSEASAPDARQLADSDFFFLVEEEQKQQEEEAYILNSNKLFEEEIPLSFYEPQKDGTQDDSSAPVSSSGSELSPQRHFSEEDLSNVDLNDFVDDMLGSKPSVLGFGNSYRMKTSKARDNGRRRNRKTKEQILVLEQEYARNPKWTRSFVLDLAAALRLSEAQVYKWNWDQRKKNMSEEQRTEEMFGSRSAFDALAQHF